MIYEKLLQAQTEPLELYWVGREEPNPRPCSFGPVIRDTYVVECCTGGHGSVIINGQEFPVGSGDCYVLLPGDTVIHTNHPQQPRQGVWCAVYGLQVGSWLTRAGIDSLHPYAPPEAFQPITALVEQLHYLQQASDPGAGLRRTACLYALFGALLSHSRGGSDKNEAIRRALGYLQTHYHTPISVSRLAAEAGLERSYFSTLFRAQTGLTPHRYLTRLRLEKACALMAQGCTVREAAEAVGIPPENFSRLFKRQLGKTPGSCRRR